MTRNEVKYREVRELLPEIDNIAYVFGGASIVPYAPMEIQEEVSLGFHLRMMFPEEIADEYSRTFRAGFCIAKGQ